MVPVPTVSVPHQMSPVFSVQVGVASVEPFVTAGTPSSPVVKEAASFPSAVLDGGRVVAGGRVGVGNGDGLTLVYEAIQA